MQKYAKTDVNKCCFKNSAKYSMSVVRHCKFYVEKKRIEPQIVINKST